MKIIDITHKAFVEAKSPYIIWFDKQCSIGLWNTQSIILCTGDSKVTVEFPNTQTTFYLFDNEVDSDELANHLTYKKTYSSSQYTQIIIASHCESECDVIETFTINEEEHQIGCEFRGLSEKLQVNLSNFGIELPESITQALYDGELWDERTDYVLLNKKYLELLREYANVIMNKGSYESLFNALRWFGYAPNIEHPLVELREVWKHTTEDGTKLGDFDVKNILSTEFRKNLSVYSKTTYFTLRCDVETHATPDKEDEYLLNTLQELQDKSSAIPIDYLELCKWAKEEMRVKMYLLGLYFEQFFCPIHIDILRSCVEDVYRDTINIGFCCKGGTI